MFEHQIGNINCKNVWNVIKLKRITQWNQGVKSKLRMFFKKVEENHLKDSYYFRQCWNQCERCESSILNIFMGKLPSFTRVEVYERCLCILNLMGWRKVWALMRQKVVRDNEEKTQLKVEQKRLHWNLGEGEERGGGEGNRGLNNKGIP